MKQVKIVPIRAERLNFTNKDNSKSEMTKIYYCVELSQTDNVVGYSILECYKSGNVLEKLKPYILRQVVADIKETGTSNGTKWSITKIDNKDI